VYLLDIKGNVLYSVVLDHSTTEKKIHKVSTEPIDSFIETNGNKYILGDDPRNPGEKKIFSGAKFNVNGKQGYIYIILASKPYEEVTQSLAGSYFASLGLRSTVLAIVFSAILGVFVIYYLTRNLREIIDAVVRFKEGDMSSRVENFEHKDLGVLGETFNHMADTIERNIDDLKSIESLRRELIANVSHDLRTPLAITQGYVETLQIKQGKLSKEETNKYLDIVYKSLESWVL